MSNSSGIQIQYQNTIIAPNPRRNHSNYNNTKQIKLKQIKLNQDPGPDEVLSEFLSLFYPSEPIPILINQDSDNLTETFNTHTKNSLSPTIPINTNISSTPTQLLSPNLNPSSSVSSDSILNSNQLNQQENQKEQLGLNTIPNHLSTIVSSPISRCHNPLPRHAELDTLASRITEPFTSLHLNPHSDYDDNHQEDEVERGTTSFISGAHDIQNDDDDATCISIPSLSLDDNSIYVRN